MRRSEGMISGAGRWLVISVILILVTGSALTLWTDGQEDRNMRDQLLFKTRLATIGINASQVATLTGSATDLGSPEYQALKQQMTALCQADPNIRFTYLIGQKPDGTYFFFVDSESPDSPDFSPPGQTYPEATARLVSVFSTGRDLTEGPVSDRWGTWISGIVTVNDPASGRRIAVFGMDVDAKYWNRQIILVSLPPITGSLLGIILVLALFLIQQRNEREQRHLEASGKVLRESEAKFRSILENTGSSTIIIENDMVISFVNPEFERITGYSKEEVGGKMSWTEIVFPEDVDEMKRYHLLRRTDPDSAPKNYEFRFITKNHQIRSAFITIGIIPGTQQSVASFIDISERKLVEQALQESEERNRTLVENAPVGILICNNEGDITFVNTKLLEMLGSSSAEKTMEINLLRFPPLEKIGFTEVLKRCLETGSPTNIIETEYMSKWGKTLYYRTHITPLTVGRFNRGALIIFDDISELKQAKNALQQTNKKMNMLNNITRHDILNQLMGLQAYLGFSKEKEKDPVILEYIMKGEQAAEVIQEQIEFTRNYQDIGAQTPKWEVLSDIIGSAIRQLKPSGAEIHIAVNGIEIFADPLIEKVFYNLMENSLRHGDHVTRLDFSVQEMEDELILVYCDNGMGISPEDKEKLFRKGFGKHTGLGLFLSREILSITKISITENGEPGKGVRFEITVPKGAYRLSDG